VLIAPTAKADAKSKEQKEQSDHGYRTGDRRHPHGNALPLHSITGLLGIVNEKILWATHLSYMNDGAELRYAVGLLRTRVLQLTDDAEGDRLRCLTQLAEWLQHGFIYNHLLFACSFMPNGNLLGQWRAYCPAGKGVSLGFDPNSLMESADDQRFQLVRCVYDIDAHWNLVDDILRVLVATADDLGEAPARERHPTQSYYSAFERHEDRLLSAFARIKHPSFTEEMEWRAVSRVSRELKDPSLRFREGPARLVPYWDFHLKANASGALDLDHVYVGPASEANLSFSAVAALLTNKGANPIHGLSASGAPWRSW
jgi:hypothetical protein